ncbi:unnamed protein product, partial [Ectocarpus sp. 4 AP-2014]
VAPLLATSFLASPSDGSLMKRTPEKNDPKVVPIAGRLVVHLLLRTFPTVFICVGLYVVLVAQFIIANDAELVSSCGNGEASDAHRDWVDIVWCLARDNARGEKAREASEQAVDLVTLELVLCLVAQSASFMYRTASIRKEPPWRNWVWNNCVIFILCLQARELVWQRRSNLWVIGGSPQPMWSSYFEAQSLPAVLDCEMKIPCDTQQAPATATQRGWGICVSPAAAALQIGSFRKLTPIKRMGASGCGRIPTVGAFL